MPALSYGIPIAVLGEPQTARTFAVYMIAAVDAAKHLPRFAGDRLCAFDTQKEYVSYDGSTWTEKAAGAQGPEGPMGPQGDPGVDGDDGANGIQGIQGIPGAPGSDGIQGIQGPIGNPGADGNDGAAGPAGPDGAQGQPGNDGAAGSAGADGKTVRSGSGVPAAGLGVDGDFYVRTATNELYGPKTAGAWGSPVSLVGPQGAAGVDGAVGPEGDAGPQGQQGIQGIQGVPGNNGAAGTNGTNGASGGSRVLHHPLMAASAVATNLAVGVFNAVSDPNLRQMTDLRGLTKVRIMGRMGGAVVAATKLRVQYHTGGNVAVLTGDAGWATLAESAGSHTVNVMFYSAEIAVPAGAQINNVLIRVGIFSGDGVVDPTITTCILNFYP